MRTNVLVILSCILLPCVAIAQRGDMLTAEQIVQRAIERRGELRRTTSMTASFTTISKVGITNDSSLVAALPADTITRGFVGRYYIDPASGTHVRIWGERGDYVPPGLRRNLIENFQLHSNYFSIDDNPVVFLNTAFPSPLAADAFQHYEYVLTDNHDRNTGGGWYAIAFRPTSTLRPGFEGELIVEGKNFDLVRVEMRPSGETALPFVDHLVAIETFSQVDNGPFQPETLEVYGSGRVGIVEFGVAEPKVSFSFWTHLTHRSLSLPIPDSIKQQPERVVVEPLSPARDVWEEIGQPLIPDERQAIELKKQEQPWHRPLGFAIAPYIDYNRAGGASVGGSGSITYGPVTVGGMGGYSFGLERPLGKASLTLTTGDEQSLQASLYGNAFSELATTSVGDKSYPRIMNTLVAATLHQDYYNFFRKDGWRVGGELMHVPLRLTVEYEQSRQFSIGNNARWSLLTWNSREFQPNPAITDAGDLNRSDTYHTLQVEIARERVAPFLKITPVADLDLRWSLLGLLGTRTSGSSFRLAEALVSASFPIARTGYNPMTLTLLGATGIGTASLPPQYQFRLRTSAASFGKPGGFVSPPKGLYGGTEYIAVGAELNTTDLWWRALGLPTWNGRGIELILAGGTARYQQEHHFGFTGTGDNWYSEAGIALSRIPLFLTELVYGRVDFRQGLGPLGQFGGNFTFVVPL